MISVQLEGWRFVSNRRSSDHLNVAHDYLQNCACVSHRRRRNSPVPASFLLLASRSGSPSPRSSYGHTDREAVPASLAAKTDSEPSGLTGLSVRSDSPHASHQSRSSDVSMRRLSASLGRAPSHDAALGGLRCLTKRALKRSSWPASRRSHKSCRSFSVTFAGRFAGPGGSGRSPVISPNGPGRNAECAVSPGNRRGVSGARH